MTCPSEILTVEQFAEKLQVSRTTVFNWIKSGDIEEGVHYIRLGRILRFCWRDDILFHNRPQVNSADAAAPSPPLAALGTPDSQRGEATVHNPPLPFKRREGPAINLDY